MHVELPRRALAVLSAAVALVAASCSRHVDQVAAPQDVNVVTVIRQDVPVIREWVGTMDGFVDAKVRAQVMGTLVKQDYKEGTAVHKGDVLFEIDPRPFDAALAQAKAQLEQAQAQLGKSEIDVARYTPLAKDKAVSEEELDNAVQGRLAAAAQVEAAKAAVQQAELNLTYSKVEAPVDGYAGLIQAQIGDLVGPGTGPLTTVSQIDPIKVYFPLSEQDYLALRRRGGNATGIPADAQFDLILTDGSVYPEAGKFFAIDSEVEPSTGTVRAVAVFPNSKGLLRPGQYARVRAAVEIDKGALLVPLKALSELQGGYQVAVVDSENKAHVVTVKTGATVGHMMVVTSGVHEGDRVVADGVQKVRDGATVNPLPVQDPASK
jgi:RND family efflux transporter MFP subunit